MRPTRIFLAAFLLTSASAFAQQGAIEHNQPKCVLAGEMPVFNVNTHQNGLLRAYFRRTGTTDWCSVDGDNKGILSTVTLPKFETGDEFEYYFVLIDERRIIAKSPQIYRGKAEAVCDTPFTRHATMITMQCLPPASNPTASSMGAGYAVTSAYEGKQPCYQSPDRPNQGINAGKCVQLGTLTATKP
jgi:hypothetical protein